MSEESSALESGVVHCLTIDRVTPPSGIGLSPHKIWVTLLKQGFWGEKKQVLGN